MRFVTYWFSSIKLKNNSEITDFSGGVAYPELAQSCGCYTEGVETLSWYVFLL